jgi:hypothetical protein
VPTTRRSPHAEITPEQRRDEIISILAVGLVRLIGAGEAAAGIVAVTLASISGGLANTLDKGTGSMFADERRDTSADRTSGMPADALGSMPAEKLSDSREIGLELPGETRLSVVAG